MRREFIYLEAMRAALLNKTGCWIILSFSFIFGEAFQVVQIMQGEEARQGTLS